jgi:acetyltransferase-like isoleucine patch superfamily enzyme
MNPKYYLNALLGVPKSLYLNFKVFNFRTALKMPIIVSYDTTIAALRKGSIIIANDNIHFAMIRIGLYSEGIYGGRGYIAIRDSGKIIFKGAFSAAKGCTLKAWGGSELRIGDDSFFNSNCKVLCRNSITIGNNAMLGWNCTITDGDGHNIYNLDGQLINSSKPIQIFENVWIGSYSTILKGTIIGANSVIGYNSLVSKKFIDTNVAIAGNPAKIIKSGIKWER